MLFIWYNGSEDCMSLINFMTKGRLDWLCLIKSYFDSENNIQHREILLPNPCFNNGRKKKINDKLTKANAVSLLITLLEYLIYPTENDRKRNSEFSHVFIQLINN